MDTRMLDVAIGLILVFSMFSLLVTTVEESFASMRNHRGAYMERLVCSLAGDNRQLAQQVMDNSFLQTMMMEKRNGKLRAPSYLDSDVFVTGLLSYLTSLTAGLRPATPAILVQELKSKLQQLDPRQAFTGSLAALLPGVENDWPAFEKRLQAWFDAAAARSTGWYKRKVQRWLFLYGFILAILLNVNPIVIAQALWRDAALRAFAVDQADIALRAHAAQTGTAIDPLPQRAAPVAATVPALYRMADKELATLRLALESIQVPSDAAIRSGDAQEILAMRRAVMEARAALTLERAPASNDAAIQRQQEDAPAIVDFRLAQLRDMLPAEAGASGSCTLSNQLLCPVARPLDQAITALLATIPEERALRSPLSGDAASAALLHQDCRQSKDALSPGLLALCEQLKTFGVFQQSGFPIGWSEAGWPRAFSSCTASSDKDKTGGARCAEPPAWTVVDRFSAGNLGIAFLGWILTAVSALLGAPFWFDLLNKLVKLRNSGLKPTQPGAADAAPTAATAPSTLSPGTVPGDEAGTTPSQDAFNETERQLTDEDIFRIQRNLGMPSGEQSGRIDLATRTAIQTWQRANGAHATGELTYMQAQQLLLNPTQVDDDGYIG